MQGGWNLVLLAAGPIVLPWLVFGLAEIWWPGGPRKPLSGWIFNAKLSLLYLAVPTLLGGAMVALISLVLSRNGGGVIDLGWTSRSGGWVTSIAAVALLLLAWDFFYYWWHRAQHEWAFLWHLHKLHHMDESLNVSTQMRCHWLEELGRIPFIFIPMALLFNLPMIGGVSALILSIWTGFIHANLRLPMGRLGMVLGGPQVHRIHHSRLPRHFDRNYAALFPFWDVLFGTYYHPARDEFPPTGVAGEPEVTTVRQAVLLPFIAWCRPLFGLLRRLGDSS